MYDKDKIKEEATPIGVIEYLNWPKMKANSRTYIECPMHMKKLGRPDRHIGNCVLNADFENAFYCSSCNAHGDAFDLIAGCLGLDIVKNFSEILATAAESCGGKKHFLIDTRQVQTFKKFDHLLSNDELTELGLKPYVNSISYISAFDESLIDDTHQLIKNVNQDSLNSNRLHCVSYLEAGNIRHSINDLPEPVLKNLVKEIALTKMERYKKMIVDEKFAEDESFLLVEKNQRYLLCEGIKNVYRKKYIRLKNIYRKVASLEDMALDDSWLYNYSTSKKEKKPGSLF